MARAQQSRSAQFRIDAAMTLAGSQGCGLPTGRHAAQRQLPPPYGGAAGNRAAAGSVVIVDPSASVGGYESDPGENLLPPEAARMEEGGEGQTAGGGAGMNGEFAHHTVSCWRVQSRITELLLSAGNE